MTPRERAEAFVESYVSPEAFIWGEEDTQALTAAIAEHVAQEREKLLSLLERRAADYRAGRLWTNGQGTLAELDWLVAALRSKAGV